MLKEGDPVPDLELETEQGKPLRLSSLRGRKTVLFFFPRAGTPG